MTLLGEVLAASGSTAGFSAASTGLLGDAALILEQFGGSHNQGIHGIKDSSAVSGLATLTTHQEWLKSTHEFHVRANWSSQLMRRIRLDRERSTITTKTSTDFGGEISRVALEMGEGDGDGDSVDWIKDNIDGLSLVDDIGTENHQRFFFSIFLKTDMVFYLLDFDWLLGDPIHVNLFGSARWS